MMFAAWPDGSFDLDGALARCAIGRAGVIAAKNKREGDGCTPAGVWAMRRVLYRSDRGGKPVTDLPAFPIEPDDGWCDDVKNKLYNRPVKLPFPARCEHLWREDNVYDLIIVLAFNDEPPRKGNGSAIFMHLARPDFGPTEGCVALSRAHMEKLLAKAQPGSALVVHK